MKWNNASVNNEMAILLTKQLKEKVFWKSPFQHADITSSDTEELYILGYTT